MRRFLGLMVSATAALVAPCANSRAQGVSASPLGYWTGVVHWRVSHESAIGQSTRHLSGSVALAPSRARPGLVEVSIKLLSSDYIGTTFQWSIAKGRCFAGGASLSPAAQLPELAITNDGLAELDVDSPITLQVDSAYHVNVYLNGVEESNVVACADLKATTAR